MQLHAPAHPHPAHGAAVKELAKRLAEAHEKHACNAFHLLAMSDDDTVTREAFKAAYAKHERAAHHLMQAGKWLSHIVAYSDKSMPAMVYVLDAFDAEMKP